MQVGDSEPEGALSLGRSALIDQSLDLTLQPCNSTLATPSPVLKSLGLLEEFWPMTEFDHLRAKHAAFGKEAMS